ncbi:MAG: phosphonoacetaldehyde hydrolase [Pseudomonadota bacterium]
MTKYRAAIFDWAGTMVDFGSFAPMAAFVEVFGRFGVEVSEADARAPMGMAKIDHIRAMLAAPQTAQKWHDGHGRAWGEADVQSIYDVFVPLNEDVAARHATLVPGAKEAIDHLRSLGLKIGSTTGYTRSIMDRILPVAAAQGYSPDNLVCSDDGFEGRPSPLGMYKCFVDLGVYPPEAVIKVDDTVPGIQEGKAAGCLTIGVALSGNYVARTPEQLAAMSTTDVSSLRDAAAQKLLAAGADAVIDTVSDLPAFLESSHDEQPLSKQMS